MDAARGVAQEDARRRMDRGALAQRVPPFALGRGVWSYRMLGARAYTIAGGTSEIQHNIIGERVLGLPKG